MNKKHFYALAACSLFVLAASSCHGLLKSSISQASGEQIAAANHQWDRVFERRSGWTGGDVAASFIIPGNRVLWVFGDSWVGDVENNRHIRAALVNNSIAIHPYDPGQPGKPPAAEQIHFYWGPKDGSGKPSAWLRPILQKQSGAADSNTWYWPAGGGMVLPGPDGSNQLALFFILVAKKQGTDSVWGFQSIGSAVAIIGNVEEPAQLWKTRVIELPHQIDRSGTKARTNSQVEWGAASLFEPGADGSPGYVFIYGVESGESINRDLILARVQPSSFEHFEEWDFFAGRGQWSKSPSRAELIVRGVSSELSIEKIVDQTRAIHYMMVESEPLFGDRIFIRTALNPEGPWSDAKPVFTVPDVKKSKTLFAYAAKGHLPLSEPGTLLISYIINSRDFNEVINNASIYRPRFITVPLHEIGIR